MLSHAVKRIVILIIFITIHSSSFAETTNGVLVSGHNSAQQEIALFLEQEKILSLTDYSHWIKTNIHYSKDHRDDIWSAPIETLRRRYGDCEDFAFLHTAILDTMGYDPKILLLIKKQSSHAICVFKKQNNLVFFDNNNLVSTRFSSEKELIQSLKKEYRYAFIEVIDHKRKPWTQKNINGILVSQPLF